MEYKLHMTPEDVYASAVRSVKQARNLCEDVEFSLEDATRSDREFIYRVVEGAIQAGATTINLPDTVGYAAVAEYGDLIRDVREHVPGADQVTATTIWGWPWPIPWRVSAQGPVRWSAP